MNGPARLFLSYSHENDAQRIKFEQVLAPLKHERLISIWNDRKILPGAHWDDRIAESLRSADIVVFLVSRALLASDYVREKELPEALALHHEKGTVVVPVMLESCDWETSPFHELQALPKDAAPIETWEHESEAWTNVAKGLRALVGAPVDKPRGVPGAGRPAEPDLTRYLEWVRSENDYIELRGMGATVAERIPLDDVYMKLQTPVMVNEGRGRAKGRRPRVGDEHSLADQPRTCTLTDLLAQHRDAVVIGDPGSGKTTFLRYVAQLLARTQLGDPAAKQKLPLSGDLLPIFVKLEPFASQLPKVASTKLSPGDCAPSLFYQYLDQVMVGYALQLGASYFSATLKRGNCFLLLDGLDEVPGDALRERVRAIIEQVVHEGSQVGNRHLITCRVRAWRGATQLAKVKAFPIEPLDRAAVEQFVSDWSRALHGVATGDDASAEAQKARDYQQQLQRAIDTNRSALDLTRNPLMLTVLAVVHWNRKALPEQRAELYLEAVNYLLNTRPDPWQRTPLQREECLRRLALEMSDHAEGLQRRIGRDDAARIVADELGIDRTDGGAFVEAEELNSGLLVSRSEGEVEFWHLTFQEYLAARALADIDPPGRWDRLRPRLNDPQWNEIVALLGGCLRKQSPKAVTNYLNWILEGQKPLQERARALTVAAMIVRDVKPYGGDPARGTPFRALLHDVASEFDNPQTRLDERTRFDLGNALGIEHDGDPRLSDRNSLRIWIEGGRFTPGEGDPPIGEHEVSGFWIGKYPVTVAEYAEFIEDGGYWQKDLWVAGVAPDEAVQPEDWEEQQQYRNRPVIGVSWFEASAYARWRGGRLPTEAQWEFCAGGSNGREYPWGREEPDESRANFDYRLNETTAVGAYPAGRTREGVYDLAGNVLEWCLDRYWDYPREKQRDYEGPREGSARVVRGGAFRYDRDWLRSAYRNGNHPGDRVNDLGFRVVWLSLGGPARP